MTERIFRTPAKPEERWIPHEYMLGSAADVSNLPTGTGVPKGSVAYTADLVNMYQYDGTAWKKIGGE